MVLMKQRRMLSVAVSATCATLFALGIDASGQVTLTVNPSQGQSGNNYTTIQAAINAVPFNSLTLYVIQISPGTYTETDIISASQQYITLQGMGANPGSVVLTGGAGAVQLTAAGNDLTVENMTVQNTAGPSAGQQNTLLVTGDKQVFNDVVISAYQDTLQTQNTGRMYVVNSTIKGTVDFIYGSATGFFYNDSIVQQSSGGVSFTAPSTPQSSNYGLVFDQDNFSTLSSGTAALSRAWNSAYAAAAFINDTLASTKIAGWAAFNSGSEWSTARLVAYGLVNSADSPINISGSPWSTTAVWPYQLTAAQAAPYTSATTVLGGWDPTQPLAPILWHGGSGTWETAGNWSSGAVPASGQGIYVEPSSTASITLSSTATVDTLSIGIPGSSGGNPTNTGGTPSALTLNSGSALTVTGELHLDGGSTLTLNGGSLTTPHIDSGNNNDQVVIENGSSLDVASWTNSNGAWPSGTITVHTGTLHLQSTGLGPIVILAPSTNDSAVYTIGSSDTLSLRQIETGAGTTVINMSGGSGSAVENLTYGLEFGSAGANGNVTFNMSGGTVSAIGYLLGAAAGTYTANQSGGTVEQYGNQYAAQEEIELGQAKGSIASWNLTGAGAQVNVGCIAVGEAGNATFNQSAGAVTLNSITYSGQTTPTNLGLHIGQSGSGTGTYLISSGSLTVDQGGIFLGYTWSGASSGGTGNFQVVGGAASINVTGNYQQNSGSTLTAEVNSFGLSTISVHGNVSFAGGSLLNVFGDGGLASNTTYTLMSWTGTESGTPKLAWGVDVNAWTMHLNTGSLTLTYITPQIRWDNSGGSGTGSLWDVASTQNWSNGGTPTEFFNGDNVTLNDANNGHYSVQLNSVVLPASVMVSGTGEYFLGGSGGIGGTGGLTKTGSGSLTLATTNNYSGATNISSGTLTLSSTGAIPNSAISIDSPGVLSLTAGSAGLLGRNFASLDIADGTVDVMSTTHSNRTLLVTGSLTMTSSLGSWVGSLDLGGNDMIVHNGNLANIQSQLKSGFNVGSGYWNGASGIISSAAATDTTLLTTLGYRQSDGSPFDGVNTTTADALIKYTYYGDANLDGAVNGADYQQIDNGFSMGLSGWSNGDFNYDGIVDGSDYSLIDNTFNQLNATDAGSLAMVAAGTNVVPEPGGIGLLGITIVGLLRGRRGWGSGEKRGREEVDPNELTSIK
jgi:pectinesterase